MKNIINIIRDYENVIIKNIFLFNRFRQLNIINIDVIDFNFIDILVKLT